MQGRLLAAGVAAGLLGLSHWQAFRAGRTLAQAGFIQQINQENTHAGEAAEKGALVFAAATMLAACSTSQPLLVTAGSLRKVVGTSLVDARGATPADQLKIDETATGLCGAGVWTRTECAKHGRRVGDDASGLPRHARHQGLGGCRRPLPGSCGRCRISVCLPDVADLCFLICRALTGSLPAVAPRATTRSSPQTTSVGECLTTPNKSRDFIQRSKFRWSFIIKNKPDTRALSRRTIPLGSTN